MSQIQSIIKNIQNIMRKDAGGRRCPAALPACLDALFKNLDDQERERELINPKYKSPIPQEFRWRAWAVIRRV